jgi:hypothetical protein
MGVTFGNATPCATSHRTQQRPHHVTLEIQVLTWDMNKDVAELNRLIGSQTTIDYIFNIFLVPTTVQESG